MSGADHPHNFTTTILRDEEAPKELRLRCLDALADSSTNLEYDLDIRMAAVEELLTIAHARNNDHALSDVFQRRARMLVARYVIGDKLAGKERDPGVRACWPESTETSIVRFYAADLRHSLELNARDRVNAFTFVDDALRKHAADDVRRRRDAQCARVLVHPPEILPTESDAPEVLPFCFALMELLIGDRSRRGTTTERPLLAGMAHETFRGLAARYLDRMSRSRITAMLTTCGQVLTLRTPDNAGTKVECLHLEHVRGCVKTALQITAICAAHTAAD